MHRRFKTLPAFIVIFSLFFVCSVPYAASLKDRMAARIPVINALKDQGLIGENNTGLLDYRTDQKPEQVTIQDENIDRQAVYAAIAKKEGVSPILVGQRRAQMIEEKGKSGHWYQSADGKWFKK